jgi:hypothetical protein
MAGTSPVDVVGDVLYGPEHERIGTITDLIADPTTLQPAWLEVKMGFFAGRHLVPAQDVVVSHDEASVPYPKSVVRSSPRIAGPYPLADEETELSEHYKTAA